MSDCSPPATNPHRVRVSVDNIALPDGETLILRDKFAAEIGISDRTARRLNLPTTYISGAAFVKRNASLQILADSAKRRNQPQKPRRTSA